MSWPHFDPVEAINQAISATLTLLGVFVGGWLTFRLGVSQLRRERAIDRRLEWHEGLLAALDDYRNMLGIFIEQHEKPSIDPKADLRSQVLTEVTRMGREVQKYLRRAELYGTPAERDDAGKVLRIQLNLYMATWHCSGIGKGSAQSLATVKALVVSLDEVQVTLTSRLRYELALPSLPRRITPRAPQNT